ncbi:hypothetical protein WA556_007138 [Blastocystis sp. ATCC 50177/Nand II]
MAKKYAFTVIRDVDSFPTLLQENLAKPSLSVIFTGDIDPATGKSWCPDCVAADPILDLFLEDQQDNTVLVCLVKRDGYKGNPNHPYRLHPLIKLQSIPTIIQFKDGKEVGRCVEKECRDEDKLYAMMD